MKVFRLQEECACRAVLDPSLAPAVVASPPADKAKNEGLRLSEELVCSAGLSLKQTRVSPAPFQNRTHLTQQQEN
jgi:hypothetical protein